MKTLRSRLILSHILPLLLIVPLVGVTLFYLLKTQVLLGNLSDDLLRQGKMTAEMAGGQPDIWQDAAEAQRFVTRISAHYQSEVILLDPGGRLVAANTGDQADQTLEFPALPTALAGDQQIQVQYTQNLNIIEVLVPVRNQSQEVVGAVRLSQQLSEVSDQFTRLRHLILILLGAELALAVIVALFLALRLERTLLRVTEAIYGVAEGDGAWQSLPEEGPQEIRRLLRAFNSLTERLSLMEESRRRLLANLVHELGRPIGAIQSAIQALINGADKDPTLRRELLTGMNDQTQRLRPLLDNLSDLHGQILGALELNRQATPMSQWLPRAVLPWREHAHEKGLHWQLDISPDMPTLNIDTDRVAQILGNLLSNAVKYTPKGTISVSAARENKGVSITVSDTGIGINPEERKHIFDPFYRSHRNKRFPQGMGLGLNIARDLAIAHGGRLSVESQPEQQGSRFTLWLPETKDEG
ncbi:MAG TPA: HAMP domain-containing histidine kinase [Chloroflexi bacterium]|nr:HAMP domain-containing histidine kinase [Chloroflexota bacterium]